MGDRTDELRALMAERVLVMDGATGTMLQAKNLGPADFGGRIWRVATRSWSRPGPT
jgi:methionine synthase I (cobalamin-dependent)